MNFKLSEVAILSYRALGSDDSNDSSCQHEDFNHRAVKVGGGGSVPPHFLGKKKNLNLGNPYQLGIMKVNF